MSKVIFKFDKEKDFLNVLGIRNFNEICVFDFIYSDKGNYVFLELNPNGQWLWLEEQSGCNLTKLVAENLID